MAEQGTLNPKVVGSIPTRPTVIKRSRLATVGFLLLSLVFVAGGTWMISDGYVFWGIFSAAFFGLGLIIFPIQLLRDQRMLVLDEQGVWVDGLQLAWPEIERIELATVELDAQTQRHLVFVPKDRSLVHKRDPRAVRRGLRPVLESLPIAEEVERDSAVLYLSGLNTSNEEIIAAVERHWGRPVERV